MPGDRDVAAIDDVLDEIALSAAGIWFKDDSRLCHLGSPPDVCLTIAARSAAAQAVAIANRVEIRVGVQEDQVFLDAAGPDSTLEYIADDAAIDATIVVADES